MDLIKTILKKPFIYGGVAFIVGSILVLFSRFAGYNYFYFLFCAALALAGGALFCAGAGLHIFRLLLGARRLKR